MKKEKNNVKNEIRIFRRRRGCTFSDLKLQGNRYSCILRAFKPHVEAPLRSNNLNETAKESKNDSDIL